MSRLLFVVTLSRFQITAILNFTFAESLANKTADPDCENDETPDLRLTSKIQKSFCDSVFLFKKKNAVQCGYGPGYGSPHSKLKKKN
jgi:hypothetical protein